MHTRWTLSIIGLGSFGRLMASHADNHFTIWGYDPYAAQMPKNVLLQEIAAVAKADLVLLAIPLSHYDEVLPQLAEHLAPQSLLIDICSVKLKPEALIRQHLPAHHNFLFTHPLFGDQTAAHSLKGRTLIITGQEGERAQQVLEFAQHTLGLELKYLTAKAHDQAMAQVHALTFFISRALLEMDLPDALFPTPSYQHLANLIALEKTQSRQLFETVQAGNLYAPAMRQRFMEVLAKLDANL